MWRRANGTGMKAALAGAIGAALLAGGQASAQFEDDAIFHFEDLVEALEERGGGSLTGETYGFEEIEFDEALFFFEENATDGDLGVQFKVDGEDWDQLRIFTPSGKRLVDIRVRGIAAEIGLTEIMSESAEPSFDDLPRAEFIALWPAGVYTMTGVSIEGDQLFGSALLTHDMPAQPVVVSPANGAEVDADDPLEIVWQTTPDPNAPPSVIVAYNIVIEKDEDEERLRVASFDMAPGDTSVTLAPGFLEAGKDYKFEIIAEETSGNKTITEVEFETED